MSSVFSRFFASFRFKFRVFPRLLFLLPLAFVSASSLQAATGEKAMVVTQDYRATAAALSILEQGGNAVDAAVAAQWVLNVAEPASSGIGGGGFFLYYDAALERVFAFDGRETAPRDAFPEMFLDDDGEPIPSGPARITGGLPVGVPGVLKLLAEVHRRFGSGKFSFAELFDPAVKLAEEGTAVSERLAGFIEDEKERLRLFEASRRIFLDSDGNALSAGYRLVQKDLARTFRLIQKEGIGIFYEGEIAKDIVSAVRDTPLRAGLMTEQDLKDYKVLEREPVRGEYRGYEIFGVGPPSSGGTTVIGTLNILEFFPLGIKGRKSEEIHFFSEAQKLAFRDCDRWIGDPDFSEVPVQKLISKENAGTLLSEIFLGVSHERGGKSQEDTEGPQTSHLSIVDEEGNVVAYTTTIEAVFGSAVVVPGRGFLLNNELSDFDAGPWEENGMPVANAPEGGKRPRSSMAPTLIFREGRPFMVLGSPGGSAIIGAVLNVMVNVIDYGLPLEEAVKAPRVIHRKEGIELEAGLFSDENLRKELEWVGNSVKLRPIIGNVQAVYFDAIHGTLRGESDPRGEGEALGY